ncbi:MAG: polysaccharide biosynthesis tyrosine autokinase [Candidatus Omnitrophica bacterium]|nr:polysaccharide biosynthesis tyrosine autokinase [Candidatus Omnitrophota bacterium]
MAEPELNLGDYYFILRKRRWIILLIFLSTFISTWWWSNRQIPVYEAMTSVKVTQKATISGLALNDMMMQSGWVDELETQTKVITSWPVMERAAMLMGIVRPGATAEALAEAVGEMQGAVRVFRIEKTNIIQLIASHTDPQKAAAIANDVAKAYIQHNLEEKRRESSALRQFLEQQLQEISTRLKQNEEALRNLRANSQATGTGLALEAELTALDTQLAALLRQYTESHPNVIRVRERIAEINDQIKGLPSSELELARLTRDVELDNGQYRNLTDKLSSARISEAEKIEDVIQLEPATVPEKPVRPNRPMVRLSGALVGVLLGLVLAFSIEHFDTSLFAIEDIERLLNLPVLGVIPYIRGPKQPGEKKSTSWWKRRPSAKHEADASDQLILRLPLKSPVVEAYRALRTNLQSQELDRGGKVLLLSSSIPGEGKTITTANLAIIFAQAGKRTLIIGADLRKPTLHKLFNLPKEPGLTDVLLGTVKAEQATKNIVDMLLGGAGWDQITKMPGLDNLHILPSGNPPLNPSELLAAPALGRLIAELRPKYDVIIFDSPPILPVTDAALISAHADGVLLLYQVGRVARRVLLRTKAQLEAVQAKLRGVILNHLAAEVELGTEYYYYQYKYYGKKEEAERKQAEATSS